MGPTTNGFMRLEQVIAAAANSELILASISMASILIFAIMAIPP